MDLFGKPEAEKIVALSSHVFGTLNLLVFERRKSNKKHTPAMTQAFK